MLAAMDDAGDVERRVLALIEKAVALPEGGVTRDTALLGRGIGLDSIEVLALVAAIETEFDVTIDDRELHRSHFATVGALVDFVRRHRAP